MYTNIKGRKLYTTENNNAKYNNLPGIRNNNIYCDNDSDIEFSVDTLIQYNNTESFQKLEVFGKVFYGKVSEWKPSLKEKEFTVQLKYMWGEYYLIDDDTYLPNGQKTSKEKITFNGEYMISDKTVTYNKIVEKTVTIINGVERHDMPRKVNF
jgi:hypothetical protein